MARPPRHNVDYFPFLCKEGKAMYYIENTYKNDGFATWVKILRELAVRNYHYLDLNDKIDVMYLSSKCNVEIATMENIIQALCDLGEFDLDLWKNKRVIWCQKLVDSIQDAYKKRRNECFTKDELLHRLGIPISIKSHPKQDKSNSQVNGNPQTILKKTIVDKTIVDKGDIFEDIEILKTNYLKDEKLIAAVISVKKNKLKSKAVISKKLVEFNNELKSKRIFQRTRDEYTSHFINWHRKLEKLKIEGNNQKGPAIEIG